MFRRYMYHILALLAFFGVILIINFKINIWEKNYLTYREAYITQNCLNEVETKNQESCKYYLTNEKLSFFPYLSKIIYDDLFPSPILLITIVITLASYIMYKFIKSNTILCALTRQKYKKLLLSIYIKCQSSSVILVLIFAIIYSLCYFSTKSFNLNFESSMSWKTNNLINTYDFLFSYFFYNFFVLMYYNNIVFLVSRKNKKFLSILVFSLFVVVISQVFFEYFVNTIILKKIFKINIGEVFNLINFMRFNDGFGTKIPVIFAFLIYLISLITIYITYKDKEKFIMDCGKIEE